MKLTFYGGAGGNVIPSRIRLDSFLLDYGDAIPKKGVPIPETDFSLLEPEKIEVLLASHGHTDHVGGLPALVKAGFNGKIESTRGTKEVTEALLRDNYPRALVDGVFERYQTPRNLLERFEIAEGVYATFYSAQGHILEASSILLEFEKENLRVLFSGDLGNTNKQMLDSSGEVPQADIVILESTYGYRELHPDFNLSLAELYEGIIETYLKGGDFFIPVLSINKLQEVLFHLNSALENGLIPDDLNIVVDSTLGEAITEIYGNETHRGLYSDGARQFFRNHSRVHPFNYTTEIKAGGKNIILASSGLDGLRGRFRKHFRDLGNENNSVAIVSHTLEGSPLRAIASGEKIIGTSGIHVPLKAKSFTLSGFSSHPDRTQLIRWLERTGAKFVFLDHGEDDSRTLLKEAIIQRGICPEEKIFTPALLEKFDLTNLPKARGIGVVPESLNGEQAKGRQKVTLLGHEVTLDMDKIK